MFRQGHTARTVAAILLISALATAFAATSALALFGSGQQTTTLVSRNSAGVSADDYSQEAVVSADGRYVAFVSHADNLVPEGVTDFQQVFRHDLSSGETTLVSVSPGGYGNSQSGHPSISSDGRFVAFDSSANDLVPGDENGFVDVFVRDMVSGETTIVSVTPGRDAANYNSDWPSISADGRHVAFSSEATDIVAGFGGMNHTAIFVRNLESEMTTVASQAWGGGSPNQNSNVPSISDDGRFVAFESWASDLVAGGTAPSRPSIFRWDLQSGETTLVSQSSTGAQANGWSMMASISDDGNRIAFHSLASNLATDDENMHSISDVFVRDVAAATTTLVSRPVSGVHQDQPSGNARLSGDGRYVAFESDASNLVENDDGGHDIFVKDLATGQIDLVSVSSDGVQANGDSQGTTLSRNGRICAFSSYATSLDPSGDNAWMDVFVASALEPTAFAIGTGSRTLSKYGDTYSLSGSLQASGAPVAGRRVVLQVAPSATATFTDTSIAATTGAGGGFTLKHVPRDKTYYRARFAGDEEYAPATSSARYATPRVSMGTPVAPKTMYAGRSKTVYGYLRPRHTSGTYPVRIYKYRYVSGKWKSYGYTKAKVANYSTYSKYSAKVKLSYKGKWRLRAYAPADSKHAATWSAKYDYVTVK